MTNVIDLLKEISNLGRSEREIVVAVHQVNAANRIASATEKIAQANSAAKENSSTTRAALASALTFGNNHSFFQASQQIQDLHDVAATEAKLAVELEGMHLMHSETLDGRPYTERKFEIPSSVNVLKPIAVKEFLDERVIGQGKATKSFAVGVTDLYARLLASAEEVVNNEAREIKLDKNNFLLIGPSGVGKTHLAFNAAELIGVPYVKVPATNLVSGANSEGVDLTKVLREFCKYDVYGDKSGKQERKLRIKDLATHGVLFIDEIDKLRLSEGLNEKERAHREAIQHMLLPLLERGEYRLGEGISFNTGDLWVICAGRFQGLEKIVSKRLQKELNMDIALEQTNEQDLVEFGFIPELARRFQNIVPFNPLSEEALLKILTEGKDSLVNQYKYRFKLKGINLSFDIEALTAIVRYSKFNSEGANGLRVAMNRVSEDLLFDPESHKQGNEIRVTEQYAKKAVGI